MRIGIIGGGTIARLFLHHIAQGDLGNARVVAILGREASERSRTLTSEYRVAFAGTIAALLNADPEVVVETADHDALRTHGEQMLAAGVDLIVLSAGAMADDALRSRLEAAARANGALLYVP